MNADIEKKDREDTLPDTQRQEMWPWLHELWQGGTQHGSEDLWKLPDKQVWVYFVRSLRVGTAEDFLCFLWINT